MEVLDVSDQQRICDFYQSILTGLIEVGVSVGVSEGVSVPLHLPPAGSPVQGHVPP